MVKDKSKIICNYENCNKPAYYGFKRNEYLRCFTHHEDNMKRCLSLCICGLAKPNFNLPGLKPAVCCIKCKNEQMINVNRELCFCKKSVPSFNLPGKKPLYCVECKLENMINVTSVLCICKKARPGFNLPGKKPLYCVECKLEGMVDVVSKLCFCGKSQPSFNLPGQKPLYCVECKLENMINVVSKLCFCGKVQPCFNYLGQKPLYCDECKLEGMVNVRTKLCNCGKSQPHFNYPDKKIAICCSECRLDGMVSLHYIICSGIIVNGITEPCPYRTSVKNDKYRGYCPECFRHNFPLDPLTFQIRKKTKEIAVRDFINSNFEGFQHDKPLQTGHCDCTVRRRIDHRKLIGNTLLVIETDENQHKSYKQMDEQTRYDDLYMAFSGKWIYIRFNPDKYTDQGKSKNPMMETRLKILKAEIMKQISRIENEENTELVERIYLYYDK
jgi:hypothetical protein